MTTEYIVALYGDQTVWHGDDAPDRVPGYRLHETFGKACAEAAASTAVAAARSAAPPLARAATATNPDRTVTMKGRAIGPPFRVSFIP